MLKLFFNNEHATGETVDVHVEIIAQKAISIKTSENFFNFSLSSSFSILNEEQQNEIVSDLKKRELLIKMQISLAPLICLYEGFPMAFLGPPPEQIKNEILINNLKQCVKKCIDKYSQPGMVIQATSMYIRGITGGLHFASHLKPPNIEKIIQDFESEEGQRAASSVRAFMISEYMPLGRNLSDSWASSFWNQNYKIDKCQYPWEKNE